jgi:hypothetical protein
MVSRRLIRAPTRSVRKYTLSTFVLEVAAEQLRKDSVQLMMNLAHPFVVFTSGFKLEKLDNFGLAYSYGRFSLVP